MKDASYQWGPLAINGSLLLMLLAVLSFYLGMRFWLRGQSEIANQVNEWTWNAGAGAIILWKFGELLLQPSLLAKGWTALMMPGSQRSIWLAIAWMILYVLWTWRKSTRSVVFRALDAWTFASLIGLSVYSACSLELGRPAEGWIGWNPEGLVERYHPIFAYRAAVGLIIAGMLYRWGRSKQGDVFGWGLAAAGAGGMIISLFAAHASTSLVYGGLSPAQWLFVAMMIGGLLWVRIVLPSSKHTKGEKEMIVMANNRSNDSKAQQEHERENKEQRENAMGVDKRLSGPNRPAE